MEGWGCPYSGTRASQGPGTAGRTDRAGAEERLFRWLLFPQLSRSQQLRVRMGRSEVRDLRKELEGWWENWNLLEVCDHRCREWPAAWKCVCLHRVQLLRGGSEQPKDGIRQSWGFAGKYSKEKEEQGWLWWWTTSKEEARIRARWKTEKGGRISRRWMALEGVKQHLEKWLKLGCHQTTVQWSRELGGSTAIPSKFWMEVIFFPEVYKKPNCKLKDIFRHKILENSPPKPPFLRKLLEDTL